MSQEYVIINVAANPPLYLSPFNTFVPEIDAAKTFPSLQKARTAKTVMHEDLKIWGDEQDNYTPVPLPTKPVAPVVVALPPVDFYEVQRKLTADTIHSRLSEQDFDMLFTPVNEITGSGQMCVGLYSDHHHGGPVGRQFRFSFAGHIDDDEVAKLVEMVKAGGWTSAAITRRGNGCAAWTILSMRSDNR